MPRFYFHAREAGELTPDTRGIELDNLAQANDEAIRAIREMIAESLSAPSRPVTFEIENEKGEIVLIVTPAEALGGHEGVSSDLPGRIEELWQLIKPK